MTCPRSLGGSAAPGSRRGAGEGEARVLPSAPRRAAGAERRAGRKARGGAAAEDGHLKWPLRVKGRFPREGGIGAAQEVGVCARAAAALGRSQEHGGLRELSSRRAVAEGDA